KRATIAQIKAHPWFNVPSHVDRANPQALAERLTQNLRQTGDLNIAAPDPSALGVSGDMDIDSEATEQDDKMMTMTNATQFTRSLLLFSQTQGGTRYTPSLTRFYAAVSPAHFLPVLVGALQAKGVKCAKGGDDTNPDHPGRVSFRIGGLDHRKEQFRGTIELEPFRLVDHGLDGSFIIMSRERGNPLSWRQLWKETVMSDGVRECVLKNPNK
ncbi:Chk1 protein kinase, partial [Ceratobasidium sp. 395]